MDNKKILNAENSTPAEHQELREQVGKLLGTAILRNDKNYTNDIMAAINAELHASIMRSELKLGTETDTAFNYARIHHWIDRLTGDTKGGTK